MKRITKALATGLTHAAREMRILRMGCSFLKSRMTRKARNTRRKMMDPPPASPHSDTAITACRAARAPHVPRRQVRAGPREALGHGMMQASCGQFWGAGGRRGLRCSYPPIAAPFLAQACTPCRPMQTEEGVAGPRGCGALPLPTPCPCQWPAAPNNFPSPC